MNHTLHCVIKLTVGPPNETAPISDGIVKWLQQSAEELRPLSDAVFLQIYLASSKDIPVHPFGLM